jgi:hypothetical protein
MSVYLDYGASFSDICTRMFKLIKLYTLIICSALYINYSSIKFILFTLCMYTFVIFTFRKIGMECFQKVLITAEVI